MGQAALGQIRPACSLTPLLPEPPAPAVGRGGCGFGKADGLNSPSWDDSVLAVGLWMTDGALWGGLGEMISPQGSSRGAGGGGPTSSPSTAAVAPWNQQPGGTSALCWPGWALVRPVKVLQITPNPTLHRTPSHRHRSASPQREGAKGLGAFPHLPSALPALAQLLPCPPAPQLPLPTPKTPRFREKPFQGAPRVQPSSASKHDVL